MKEERLLKLINKQFEIIGETQTFEKIPDSGIVVIGKKKDYWYNIYKFTEEQEKEWKEWVLKELEEEYPSDEATKKLQDIELKYGFVIRYKKKGELF